jgi:hypothetical protein
MALLMLPLGLIIGLIVADEIRAFIVTLVIGLTAVSVLFIVALAGVEVSPLEVGVLLVGTPIAMWLARLGVRLRHPADRVRGRAMVERITSVRPSPG